MKMFAQALDLVDDAALIRTYTEHHREVWPEVTAGLRAIGIERMKIFRSGTRLFMYIETHDDFDPARDYQRYAEDPKTREWDELMRQFQRQVPGAAGDTWWTLMEEVFDLESAP